MTGQEKGDRLIQVTA